MPKILVKVLKVLFAGYLILGCTLWFISPWVISHYASSFLATKNLVLTDNSTIRYNPFISQITVNELELSTVEDTNTPVLQLESAEIELGLWRLLTKTLYVSQFDIEGLIVNVNKSSEELNVAGWPIAPAPSNEQAPPLKEEQVEQAQSKAVNLDDYQVKIPAINIDDSAIKLNWLEHQHVLALSKINIEDLLLSLLKQQANIELNLRLNDSPITLTSALVSNDMNGSLNYQLAINDLKLADFNHFIFPEANELTSEPSNEQASVELLAGQLSITSQQKIDFTKQTIKSTLSAFEFSVENLLLHNQGANIAVATQQLIIEDLAVDVKNWNEESPVIVAKGNASVEIAKLNVYTAREHLTLAKMEAFSIPSIIIANDNNENSVSMPKINIEQIDLSDDSSDEIPSLLQLKLIEFVELNVSESGLSINNIDITGVNADIKIAENKTVPGLISLNNKENLESDKTTTEEIITQTQPAIEEPTGKPFSIFIGEIKLADNGHIRFVDESVKPLYEQDFTITQFTAGAFDNQKTEQLSVIKLEGKSNKYAHFTFNTSAKPFASSPYYKLDGHFKEIHLPAISPYIKNSIQYEFDSGHLDVELDVEVNNTDIDGETRIFLRGVEFGAANNPHNNVVAGSTSVPFNYALGMLKDSDGNVELDIPLKGSTSSPDFSLEGFLVLIIKRATMSAAQDYLLTTFVPYANIVKVGMTAGEYLLKVRFNDLPFETGQSSLTDSSTDFLKQFSALMKDKENTELTICAMAIPEDIGLPHSTEDFNEQQLKQLNDLSVARMETFKSYMVQEQGIASARLLLCSPKVDNAEKAQPRITFTD